MPCDGLDNDCNPATPDSVDADGDGFDSRIDWNLRFPTRDDVVWDAPLNPGGTGVRYDTIRSGDPTDFGLVAATCVESDDGTDTTANDVTVPAPGAAFYYLVRAENNCLAGLGSLGNATGGGPRTGRNCP